MTSVILKVLALSGVVSAGFFAVWKANTDLQPQTVAEFTAVEVGAAPAGDTDPSKELALADFPTEVDENSPAKGPARQMPTDFGGEPDTAAAPTIDPSVPTWDQSEPEVTPPEPGVADLNTLEKADATRESPLYAEEENPSLQKFPREAGGPELLKIPAAKQAVVPPRIPTPSGVVPANSEEVASDQPTVTPALRHRAPAAPVLPADESPESTEPIAPDEPDAIKIRPARGAVRPTSIPEPAPETVPTTPASSVPRVRGSSLTIPLRTFNESAAEPGADSPIEPQPEPTYTEPEPVAQPALRTRGSIPELNAIPDAVVNDPNQTADPEPTPESDSDAPAEWPGQTAPRELNPHRVAPARKIPTNIAADGVEVTPRAGRSIPKLPAAQSQGLNPNLIGNGTLEDGLFKQSQQPQLNIEKIAQADADVGVSFIYEIIVKNVGDVDAYDVHVEERIPKGTQFQLSKPLAVIGQDRIARFKLETIPARTEKVIQIKVLPLEAGAVGSVATVRFASKVAAKTTVTAPRLEVSVDAPKEAAVGEQVTYTFHIKNIGSGTARKSTLRVILPEGLKHPRGDDLDQELGVLAPGQTIEKTLSFVAEDAGRYPPEFFITANGLEQVNRQLDLSVIQSRLSITRTGPAKRFVDRPAEFVTTVTNLSDEPLNGVRVTEVLPVNIVPVGDRTGYEWNEKTRTVSWMIGNLGPGHSEILPFTVLARHYGDLAWVTTATDDANHRANLENALEVKGYAALELDFDGTSAPVSIGEPVSMRLTVKNGGSAPAKNVVAVFELPQQMQFVSGQGPGKLPFTQDGNLITFEEIGEIQPNSSQTYDIVLTAAQEGQANVKAALLSDDLQGEVSQEQQIRVKSDEP